MTKAGLLILIVLMVSCSTPKQFADNKDLTITFGSQGGFTGQDIYYKLDVDGKLWKFRGIQNDSSLLKQLKKGKTNKVFKQAFKLGMDTLKFQRPGNMNNYIEINSTKIQNKIVWEQGSDGINDVVPNYFNNLNNLVNSQ
jgi:hypothetical protein